VKILEERKLVEEGKKAAAIPEDDEKDERESEDSLAISNSEEMPGELECKKVPELKDLLITQ
jgi:hypothetical protein